MANVTLQRSNGYWCGEFRAMASPCEVLVDTDVREDALALAEWVADEAGRVEQTYSRYLDHTIISRINRAAGQCIEVDEETAELFDFAARCHELSDGLFDITSGVLRRAWRFEVGAKPPTQAAIDALLPLVGWHQVRWQRPTIQLPANMQIDLGGIAKEYAVDRAVQLLRQRTDSPCLVNFGGDLHASAPPRGNRPWRVGIEQGVMAARRSTHNASAHAMMDLLRGALATSGDAYRCLVCDGVRYGHVLNPATGWPVPDAPHSVTVASNSCTEAGILSTLAMLKGEEAERFLDAEQVRYWCQRELDCA